MTTLPKAFCGYNQEARAYVPYSGNLTKDKEAKASDILRNAGFRPGWKCSNVEIQPPHSTGFSVYKEDGAGGMTIVKVFPSI